MKNILLLVHEDSGQEARLQAALDLGRALGGHISCLDVSIVPVMIDDYAATGGAALLLADEEAREQDNRARLDARLRVEDVPYDWTAMTGDLTACVEEASGLADLVVINRRLDDIPYPDMRGTAAAVIRSAGKPVVAVPESARGFDAAGRALVAWDGSKESMDALQAAVPLLRLASDVTLIEIDDGTIEARATEAAEYLSRHGIKPEIRMLAGTGERASAALLEEVRILGAAYVVMGGYGHSPLRETLFGGVTRRMLTDCPVPLFLAH